jgi:hypothetical protein
MGEPVELELCISNVGREPFSVSADGESCDIRFSPCSYFHCTATLAGESVRDITDWKHGGSSIVLPFPPGSQESFQLCPSRHVDLSRPGIYLIELEYRAEIRTYLPADKLPPHSCRYTMNEWCETLRGVIEVEIIH